MNGIIGTIETQQVSVLCGDHHITESAAIKDGEKNLKAGQILSSTAAGFTAATAAGAADAVLLEDFAGTASGTVLAVCVHGTVRAEKLLLGAAAAPESVRAKLRTAGIYVRGALAADA